MGHQRSREELLLPPRVRRGDTVAVVSPCSTEVFWPEHRGELGSRYLERLGLHVRVMPHSGPQMAGKTVSPKARADDINSAFADPSVTVVLCAIGGDESIDVVPYLDFDLIRRNPKIFQGLSDPTVLHWAINRQTGLVTFHGPNLLPSLGEYPQVLDYTDRYLQSSWLLDDVLAFEPSGQWTDEYLDWLKKLDLQRARRLESGQGWRALRPGRATGRLVGGCFETIYKHLLHTDLLDFDGAIAFFETSEMKPSDSDVRRFLTEMTSSGALDGVRGLILGRPYLYSDAEKEKLWEVLAEVGAELNVPVLADVDCGHTDPVLTLPFGLNATIDCDTLEFRMLEVATEASQGR